MYDMMMYYYYSGREMCSCKAIISGRLHGAILGLHMGVPTFGFFATPYGDKVPDLMIGKGWLCG